MMDDYDERPISVYDNLNMPTTTTMTTTTPTTTTKATMQTSTPKAKTTAAPTTSLATTTNGATCSPYADISFQFNDNNNTAQQQQQLQQQQQQQLLPNGNRSANQNQQQQQQQQQLHTLPSQVHQQSSNNADYATPYKTASKAATLRSNAQATTTTTTTPATTSTTALNAISVQRPLSQHSQSELYEATQSIAAVKAALNDAKSKFFGLNGYTQENPTTTTATAHQPKVQIATPPPPPPKPQPKYQNIPENSAIFRKQPPELPPKPIGLHAMRASSTTPSPPPPAAAATVSEQISADLPTQMSAPTTSTPAAAAAAPSSHSPSVTPIKTLPHATYTQLPLNDIDAPQPSQAVYMATTVPQNIKGSKIAGRHTPTRNSLRHSRMLVVNNKNYQGKDYPNPMNFKQPFITRWLLILQILIGLFLSVLAIWILFLAPNTAIQDNPYWCGLALLLAGIVGLVLIRYQRIKRHKVRENCFKFLRADSYILALLAVVLCCVALVCAALHYARLTANDTKCVSTNMLLEHGSCTCTFNAVDQANVTNGFDSNGLLDADVDDVEDHSYKVEYRDLSCEEVKGAWTCVLRFSIALSALGLLVSVLYVACLACCCRNDAKRMYTSVHTSTF